ncbi:DUF2442 domain-containing protein [Thermoflexus hugenholtzii]
MRLKVLDLRIADERLVVDVEDGRTLVVPLSGSPCLVHGSPKERRRFEIAGAGYGIHWPDPDEDVSVEGLLLGKPSAESPASLARWLASRGRKRA